MGKRKPKMSLKRGTELYYKGYNRWVKCIVHGMVEGGGKVAVFLSDTEGVVPVTDENLRGIATRSLWSYVPDGKEKAEA